MHTHERRAEIQALRAFAVLAVIVFHAWPRVLPGGYLGVDVFFVISGFLITGLLLDELAHSGRIALVAFWARRARRLLPAAFLTLIVCTVGTVLIVPRPFWQPFLREIAASATYFENWRLSADAIDYHAAGRLASPVKHFWSLSVEEQFYVLWPLLILAAAGLAAVACRVRWIAPRRAVGSVLAAATLTSLAWAIVRTGEDPTRSYYSTFTRAWEFGAGGLLALSALRVRGPVVAAAGSWLGLLAIGAATLVIDAGAAVPGAAALVPVCGALLVIACGMPAARFGPAALLRPRLVQLTGDISYSAYLWHWPLLVSLPFLVGTATGPWRAVAVAATLPIAWCSFRLVEDPLRRTRLPALNAPRRTLALAAVAGAFVVAAPVAAMAYIRAEVRDARGVAEQIAERAPACFGAADRDPLRSCSNPQLLERAVPAPIAAAALPNAHCTRTARWGPINACEFGAPETPGTPEIALVGDSHASHWRAALTSVAQREGWHGVSVTHSGCAFSEANKRARPALYAACVRWRAAVPRWLARHPRIHTIFVSGITGGDVIAKDGRSVLATEVAGYEQAWAGLPESVRRVVVLRDTPRVRASTVACVQRALDAHRPTSGACGVPRAQALKPDPAVIAAGRSMRVRTSVIDLTKVFCGRLRCFPVIGGALVFKDVHHLTPVFSRTLGPILQHEVAGLVNAPAPTRR